MGVCALFWDTAAFKKFGTLFIFYNIDRQKDFKINFCGGATNESTEMS